MAHSKLRVVTTSSQGYTGEENMQRAKVGCRLETTHALYFHEVAYVRWRSHVLAG